MVRAMSNDHEFGINTVSPAERALTEAKDEFRSTMMGCEPFADLVMAHITDPRQRMLTELPDFGCEPWRYVDHTGEPDGYGVRLVFSATGQSEEVGSGHRIYDYIKIARVNKDKELFAGVLVNDIEDRQPDLTDPTDVEHRAELIVKSYFPAFNDFARTEVPGDKLVVDSATGVFDLSSKIEERNYIDDRE
jgi:hypothetical protein